MVFYKNQMMPSPDLHFADGLRAHALKQFDLFRRLHDLGVPDVTSAMGKTELLRRYEVALHSRIEAMRRNDASHPADMKQLMARAVQEMSAQ